MIDSVRRRLLAVSDNGDSKVGGVARPLTLLAVGDIAALDPQQREQPQLPGLVFAKFHEVNADTLAEVQPDVVLSPLVANGFDCHDLASALTSAGFNGSYRAVTGDIPNPGLIRNEVAASFPDLDFDIFIFGNGGDQSPG